MTTGGPDGTNGAGARPADGLAAGLPIPLWWAYAAALATIAVVTATSFWVEAEKFGRPIPLVRLLVLEATSVLVIFGLTIPIFAASVRLSVARLGWPSVLAAHALGAVAFSLAHVAGMSALRWLIFTATGDAWSFGPLWQGLFYELRKDVLVYAGLVASILLLRRAMAQRQAVPAIVPTATADAPPERIEIRDGARRTWLTPDEILWIEAAGNYVELHTRDRHLLWRRTLASIETELAGRGFRRIHRSRLVNLRHVGQYATNDSGDFTLTLSNGATIGGARRWREAFDKAAGV